MYAAMLHHDDGRRGRTLMVHNPDARNFCISAWFIPCFCNSSTSSIVSSYTKQRMNMRWDDGHTVSTSRTGSTIAAFPTAVAVVSVDSVDGERRTVAIMSEADSVEGNTQADV